MITEVHSDRYGAPKYVGQAMSKTDFLRWESDDNYVYEFNNGVLEPTNGIRQDEILLFKQISGYFSRTISYQQGGELLAEVDYGLPKNRCVGQILPTTQLNNLNL